MELACGTIYIINIVSNLSNKLLNLMNYVLYSETLMSIKYSVNRYNEIQNYSIINFMILAFQQYLNVALGDNGLIDSCFT